MNNFTFKDNLLWRSLLIRSALVIVTVAIVVWAMPHDTANTFPVEEGKPWRYAELTAPFDFPVLKSDAAIRHERDSVLRNYEPYYNYDGTTETRMVRKFTTDYADSIPGLPLGYTSVIANRLHSLYQQGIMPSEEYEALRRDTSSMIRVVNQKQASSVSIMRRKSRRMRS